MKTLGRLSHGIDLGWKTGFSSGQSLDHVYSNKARGRTVLGRAIDRTYLDSIGWRMIRVRREHVCDLLRRAVTAHARLGEETTHVVDIAAGAGRYLVETIEVLQREGIAVTATLRDRSEPALAEARRLADERGVRGIDTRVGDAFDDGSLSMLSPMPDVAVVSGLYELIPDNRRVLTSLRGLAAAMPDGAALIYTNQPWHPQLEMIARVLVHGDGSPWVMRCRSQAEMDELVCAAGFEKVEQLIDEHGLFSVSLARRRRS
jgi:hypothetical protein